MDPIDKIDNSLFNFLNIESNKGVINPKAIDSSES